MGQTGGMNSHLLISLFKCPWELEEPKPGVGKFTQVSNVGKGNLSTWAITATSQDLSQKHGPGINARHSDRDSGILAIVIQ